ncbi:MAG: ABC transporter ATP-binding protein [Planctomycetota bacterium]
MDRILEARGLTKSFGEKEAVRGVDLDVARGSVHAFLGPNGAGKSTTILMLMGILRPTAGTARIDGLDCFADRVEVKRRVGYLPDEPQFYDYLSGRELIGFVGGMHGLSKEETWRRAEPILEGFRIADQLDEFAVNYSHGTKKKLAFAFALLHEPDLLILDEPTNGLDPHTTRIAQDIVRDFAARGGSVFFSTHLLDQAEKLCDRVDIVAQGRIVATGTIREVKDSLAPGGTLEDVFFAVTQAADEA